MNALEELRNSDYAEQNKTIHEAVNDVTDKFSIDELPDQQGQDEQMNQENREKKYLTKTRQQLADMFLNILKSDDPFSWKRGWTVEAATNATTGRDYRGINRFVLEMKSISNGYRDHRWCTFKQATDAGWKIKKGSKGTPVEFWSYYDKITKKTLNYNEYHTLISKDPEYEKNIRIISREYTVFNGEQIEGISELEIRLELTRPEELEKFLENLQKEMDIKIIHGGNKAFYLPVQDEIHVPVPEQFHGIYEYYSTTLHEAGHATGAASRLNRDLTGIFGSEKYAKEELRAEIASCFISNDLGIPADGEEHDRNHAAYIQSWIKFIEDAPAELMKAIKDAEKISDYIEEKGNIEQLIENRERKREETKPDQSQTEKTANKNMIRLRLGTAR